MTGAGLLHQSLAPGSSRARAESETLSTGAKRRWPVVPLACIRERVSDSAGAASTVAGADCCGYSTMTTLRRARVTAT
jgi:hypothetical protein